MDSAEKTRESKLAKTARLLKYQDPRQEGEQQCTRLIDS
jgi:hypothetical protein